MKRILAVGLLLAGVWLAGCAPSQPPQTSENINPTPAPAPKEEDEVVATVNGDAITMKQLQEPLLQAHGLPMLRLIMQLDLARQEAAQAGVSVTPQDIQDEITRTLIAFKKNSAEQAAAAGGHADEPATDPSDDDTLTQEDRDRELGIVLAAQRATETEFNIAMERNAIIRKLVTPEAEAQIKDQDIQERFNVIYGEKARTLFISLPDMMTVSTVVRDMKAGKTFEDEMALHAYDSAGHNSSGALQPFARNDARYPAEFRMVAFGLKPGDVSDPVQLKDSIYLIKLVELIPPTHATFDVYKDAVRKELLEQTVQIKINDRLRAMGQIALKTMEIKNPILLSQWNQMRSADDLRARLAAEAQQNTTTQPAAGDAPAAGGAAAGGAGAATAPSN